MLLTCFVSWSTDSQKEEGIHQKQVGSEKRQETEQEVCLAIEWKRWEWKKEENKRQGKVQLVSNPPIKKKNKNVVWRRPPENVWLEAVGPGIAMMMRRFHERLEDGDLHRSFNLTTLDLICSCSFFCFFFCTWICWWSEKRCPCLKQQALFFVVQFNIIQPNAKTTNKY